MKDIVEFLAQRLVTKPAEVRVAEQVGEAGSMLELRVAKEDLGRVIGKHGRTASAIRSILMAVASREGRKVMLEIVD